MFPVKKFRAAPRREIRAAYDRFAVFGKGGKGTLAASGGENCDCSDGCIRPGVGWAEPEIPLDYSMLAIPPARFFALPAHGGQKARMIFINQAGSAYVFDEASETYEPMQKTFALPLRLALAYGADDAPRVAAATSAGTWISDGVGPFVSALSSGGPMCFCRDRLFVAAGSDIFYSAPLDPADFTESIDEGGCVRFPAEAGEIVALGALEDRVYAFRRRGIFRLRAAGAGRDFEEETPGYGGGEILGASGGTPDARIYLLAKDGMYAFDGREAVRIFGDVPLSPAEGEVRFGRTGKNTVMFYRAQSGEDRLFVFDGEAESGYFSSLPCGAFSPTAEGILCDGGGRARAIVPGGELPSGEYVFTAETDFGVSGRKFWKELRLEGEGSCRVEAESAGEKRRFTADLGGGARLFPKLSGERFSLRISLSAGAAVKRAEVKILTFR